MKKTILAIALMASMSAFATPKPTPKPTPTPTPTPVVNHGGSAAAAAVASATIGNVGGGAGGAGGSARASVGGVGNGIGNFSPSATIEKGAVTATGGNAAGGSVIGSGNSTIAKGAVENNNLQLQGQVQGQKQSISDSGNSAVKNSGNSLSVSEGGSVKGSGNSTNDNSNAVKVSTGDNAQSVETGAVTQSVTTVDPNSLEIAKINAQAARDVADTTIKIKNTPSVSGPALTSSNDTCMGSTSGSANVPGIGIGFGTSWVDNNCKMLKNSRELWNMGMKAAAMALMCNDPDNRAALEVTGYECPTKGKKDAKPVATVDTQTAPVAHYAVE